MSEVLGLNIDVLGHWLAIFLTFCILSFLYKDNPFYKLAEHLFIGVSIGYVVTQQYYNVLRPKLIERIADADHWFWNWDLIPLILTLLMFVKAVSKRWAWMGRYPLAFVVAFYAGLQINGVAQADLGRQIKRATESVDVVQVNINTAAESELTGLPGVSPGVARSIIERRAEEPFTSLDEVAGIPGLSAAERIGLEEARGSIAGLDARATVSGGDRYWFGVLSNVLLLLGLIASLVYFYFSVPHTGLVGKVSRFGVWVLMIGFGASFGYTVQGRIALAIGRAQYVLGSNMDQATRESVQGWKVALVSVAVIIIGIAVWERKQRRRASASGA
jgi:hypothetical protein